MKTFLYVACLVLFASCQSSTGPSSTTDTVKPYGKWQADSYEYLLEIDSSNAAQLTEVFDSKTQTSTLLTITGNKLAMEFPPPFVTGVIRYDLTITKDSLFGSANYGAGSGTTYITFFRQ